MLRIYKILIICSFVGFLGFLGGQTLFKEQASYSDLEFRNLSQRPDFTFNSAIQGTYPKDFESYFQDQFYKRIGLSKYFYKFQTALYRPSIENILIGKDGWLASIPNSKVFVSQIPHTIKETQDLYEYTNKENIPLYLSINPSKDITLFEQFPYHYQYASYPIIKKSVLDKLDKRINIIDNSAYFKKKFSFNELKNLYYKTDHHWNLLGGYYNYEHLINKLHQDNPAIPKAIPQEQLKKVCANRDRAYFLGSQNRSLLKAFDESTESVCSFSLPDEEIFSEVYATIYTGEKRVGMDKIYQLSINQYEQSYGGLTNNDLPEIVHKMKNPPNNIKALIIKDSYTNAMLPMITTHFAETRILDMRHYKFGSVEDYIKEHNINLVILSHNDALLTGDTFSYSGNRIDPRYK